MLYFGAQIKTSKSLVRERRPVDCNYYTTMKSNHRCFYIILYNVYRKCHSPQVVCINPSIIRDDYRNSSNPAELISFINLWIHLQTLSS